MHYTPVYIMTKEQKRLERLRNQLSPLYGLADMVLANADSDKDLSDIILSAAKRAKLNQPLIKDALELDITYEELGQLYLEDHNKEPIARTTKELKERLNLSKTKLRKLNKSLSTFVSYSTLFQKVRKEDSSWKVKEVSNTNVPSLEKNAPSIMHRILSLTMNIIKD